jgi:four helix bundle protein
LLLEENVSAEERGMQDFRRLKVWEKAHWLTLAAYRVTKTFPSDERFGLTAQILRSAASIPANIAEGCGRDGARELARFAQIAMGSASELAYHFLLAHDLEYLAETSYRELATALIEVQKMLASFLQRLRA